MCCQKTHFALTNVDDKNGMVMLRKIRLPIKKTYGLKNMADYKGQNHGEPV